MDMKKKPRFFFNRHSDALFTSSPVLISEAEFWKWVKYFLRLQYMWKIGAERLGKQSSVFLTDITVP